MKTIELIITTITAILLAAHLGFFNNYLVAVGVIDNSISTTISEGKNNITNTSHATK